MVILCHLLSAFFSRLSPVQNLINPARSAGAVHPGMEAQAERAQRDIKLRRQEQQEQGRLESHLAVEQTQSHLHRHQRCADRCHQFEH